MAIEGVDMIMISSFSSGVSKPTFTWAYVHQPYGAPKVLLSLVALSFQLIYYIKQSAATSSVLEDVPVGRLLMYIKIKPSERLAS